MIQSVKPFTGRRLCRRRVDEIAFAEDVGSRALERDDWVIDVEHGGGVANSYGYAATTECVLAVSDPFGFVLYWTARVPANKVTYRGAAEACIPGAGDLFDGRVGDERKSAMRNYLVNLHRSKTNALEIIANASR